MSDTVNIEINGIKLEVPQGSMVIEAADQAGITIPRFCYHKKLSVAANCRMCLVEVEKAPKPLPACATPVTDGMNVQTRSPMALEAQKSVMEFLLINHPLDCPICDQGGECDLQDIAMGFGGDISRFVEKKRVVKEKNIGPLIATDMTRCIHCTRCVRFGQEIAGIRELGATGRGEHTEIGTYVESTVDSEMSGNVIDLCPVGALTSKPYRYSGRPWENQQYKSIAPHDCVGSNITVDVRRGQVMRVLPRENEAINEIWLSDRDRFSYTGLHHRDRLRTPMIKQGNSWKSVDWETALAYAVEGLQRVKQAHGIEKIGAVSSPSATTEEMFLLQKLMRGLGCANIDHRTRQLDFSNQDVEPIFPWLGQSIAELQDVDAALLIGSNIRKDQPIISHRLRKAALNGAQLMFVNPIEYDFNFPVEEQLVSSPAGMVNDLVAICKALLSITGDKLPQEIESRAANIETHDDHLAIAKHLHAAEKATVLIGNQSMGQAELGDIRTLANIIAQHSNATLGYLSQGANSAGACLAGMLPHRGPAGTQVEEGLNSQTMLGQTMGGMVLLQLEPEFDCADPGAALNRLKATDFVISLASFASETTKSYADVLLPVSAFTETSGTYVNVEGHWQSFAACVSPLDDARPAWKVLRVLGNLFKLDGFDYMSSEEVRDECQAMAANVVASSQSELRKLGESSQDNQQMMRIGYLPIYATDMLVRRAQPLQETSDAINIAIHINADTLSKTKLNGEAQGMVSQDGQKAAMPIIINENIPDQCIMVPAGVIGSEQLGNSYGPVDLSKS